MLLYSFWLLQVVQEVKVDQYLDCEDDGIN